jgi:hypothetical protein
MMTVRSGGLMPRNFTESSARLSWRGAVAGAGPVFWFSISLLLDDDRVVRGASPISSLAEESMQFDERVHRYPAGADLHTCARDRIEHPRRHNRDDAGLRFDLHEPPGDTLLAAAEANATPVEGMPAIMDHDFLPDMGRMTRRWLMREDLTSVCSGRAAAARVP